MLAKIAYGCAVAAVGCDLSWIEPLYVLPAILSRSAEIGRCVCGASHDQPPAEYDLHDVKFFVDDGELRSNVRLSAQCRAP